MNLLRISLILLTIILLFLTLGLNFVSADGPEKDIFDWLEEVDEDQSTSASVVKGLDPAEQYFSSYAHPPEDQGEYLDENTPEDATGPDRETFFRSQDFHMDEIPNEAEEFNSEIIDNYRVGEGKTPMHIDEVDEFDHIELRGINNREIRFAYDSAYFTEMFFEQELTVHYTIGSDNNDDGFFFSGSNGGGSSGTGLFFPDGEGETKQYSDPEVSEEYVTFIPKDGSLTYLQDGIEVHSKTGPVDTADTECSCGIECSYTVVTRQERADLHTDVPDVDNLEITLVDLDGEEVFVIEQHNKTSLQGVTSSDYHIDPDEADNEEEEEEIREALNEMIKLEAEGEYNITHTQYTRNLRGACSDDPEWSDWRERGTTEHIEDFEYESDHPYFIVDPQIEYATAYFHNRAQDEVAIRSSPTPLAFKSLHIDGPNLNSEQRFFNNRMAYFTARDTRWDPITYEAEAGEEEDEDRPETNILRTSPRENFDKGLDNVEIVDWNVSIRSDATGGSDPVDLDISLRGRSDLAGENWTGNYVVSLTAFHNGRSIRLGDRGIYTIGANETVNDTIRGFTRVSEINPGVHSFTLQDQEPKERGYIRDDTLPWIREFYNHNLDDSDSDTDLLDQQPVHILRTHAYPSTGGFSQKTPFFEYVDNKGLVTTPRPEVEDSWFCGDNYNECKWDVDTELSEYMDFVDEQDRDISSSSLQYALRYDFVLRSPSAVWTNNEYNNYYYETFAGDRGEAELKNRFHIQELDIAVETVDDSTLEIRISVVIPGVDFTHLHSIRREDRYPFSRNIPGEYLLIEETDSDNTKRINDLSSSITLNLDETDELTENASAYRIHYEKPTNWWESSEIYNPTWTGHDENIYYHDGPIVVRGSDLEENDYGPFISVILGLIVIFFIINMASPGDGINIRGLIRQLKP